MSCALTRDMASLRTSPEGWLRFLSGETRGAQAMEAMGEDQKTTQDKLPSLHLLPVARKALEAAEHLDPLWALLDRFSSG